MIRISMQSLGRELQCKGVPLREHRLTKTTTTTVVATNPLQEIRLIIILLPLAILEQEVGLGTHLSSNTKDQPGNNNLRHIWWDTATLTVPTSWVSKTFMREIMGWCPLLEAWASLHSTIWRHLKLDNNNNNIKDLKQQQLLMTTRAPSDKIDRNKNPRPRRAKDHVSSLEMRIYFVQ